MALFVSMTIEAIQPVAAHQIVLVFIVESIEFYFLLLVKRGQM